ncbi:Retrovirus-related Pol polyprotein from type-1 retrotransposable element R1 [Araneus ventricosus]|uniref:Retrovirus-related Pol polyprotein from type-1 retrotransposable element R1 n=1 Tax=Araneus ventricosus TaxID=182803 RepID=A0A4Y2TC58_ARAVE|nr:Retrovirus-related Pol polyprotein from type-1 retrotransposable element R1 [Araneus ventricosus]
MVKKEASQKGNASEKSGEGSSSTQISNADKYANDLKIMIEKIDPEDYTEEAYSEIMEWFTNLEKFSTEMVDAGLTYGKIMRNNFVRGHYKELLPILQNLCAEIRRRDADIYDLKNSLAESEYALLKAKVWTLEREKASLRAKLDLNSDMSSTIKEILPKLDELKNHNAQALKEELPSFIKQAACPDIKSSLESGSSPLLTPKEPEGILLIKPKDETLRDFDANLKIILDILQTNSPEGRLRGVGKIFGGGVKLIAASPDDIVAIKDTIIEHCDKEMLQKFDLVTPNCRFPQFILYNVPKEVEENTLKAGLLAKNIFLTDGNNKAQFKLEFNIPARDQRFSHWVMSVNPKKYEDFKNKEGLYFQFSRLRLSEFISVKQCRKCHAFGHTTKGCDPNNKQLCDKCGEIKEDRHRCRGSQSLGECLNYSPVVGPVEPLILEDLEIVFGNLKDGKAPGLDRIDYSMWRAVFNIDKDFMLKLFNLCFKLNYFPQCLRKARIFLLLKDRKDPGLCSSYRPICLLPTLGKIVERLFSIKLNRWLDQNDIIHQNQFGFLEGKSCDLAITQIVETIKSRIPTEHLALVSLDIRSAFDNMNWPVLFNILTNYGLPKFFINFLFYYLDNRKVFYVNEIFSISRQCFRGCPQGSVIAPTLWNLYINSILLNNNGELYIQDFADDLALIIGGRTARDLEKNTNLALAKISTDLDSLKLTLSIQKCQAVVYRSILSQKLFKRNSTVLNRKPTFKINNISIKITDSLKILGIHIDEKLSWTAHVNSLHDKI